MININHRSRSRVSFTIAFGLTIASVAVGCGGSAQVHGSSDGLKSDAKNPQTIPSDKPVASSVTNGETKTTPTSTSRAVSPFHIVADVDYGLELQRLGKTAVLVAGGQLLPIRENTVTFEPKYALGDEIIGDGIHGAFQELLGSFPDALFASVVRPWGRTGLIELYKWTGSKWTNHYSSDTSTSVLDVQPWRDGTVLMVEFHDFSGEYRFSALPQSTKVFLPEPHDYIWKGGWSMCQNGFVPGGFRTLPSGHIFMLGATCSSKDEKEESQTAMKRWSPGEKAGAVDILPDIGPKGFTLVNWAIRNEKDVYIGGNTTPLPRRKPERLAPYLAHFDGNAWTTNTLPFSDSIASLDVDGSGNLWLVSSTGAVYSRPAGGAWTEISLSEAGEDRAPISASTIWARGPGDEWILGTYKSRHVVLHSGPRGEMAQLPNLETMSDKAADLAMPTPLTWRCPTPFVLLFTLSKVAPPNFDYPATREALKGHTEFEGAKFIEFKRLDKRYMGAFVPDVEMGQKLVDLVQKKVPNSTPQLACHNPKPLRPIEIDLASGK